MDDFDDLPEIYSGGAGAILSSLYRHILLSLGINAPLFNKLIYNYCCRVISDVKTTKPALSLKNREKALTLRLVDEKFTLDTFLVGMSVLGIRNITFILTLENDDGVSVKKVTSSPISLSKLGNKSVNNKLSNAFLYEFLNKIMEEYEIDFDFAYDLIKKKYKSMAVNKAGKCFISNLARDYRNKSITWNIFYRILPIFEYNRGSIYVVLEHGNGKQNLFKKSFIIV